MAKQDGICIFFDMSFFSWSKSFPIWFWKYRSRRIYNRDLMKLKRLLLTKPWINPIIKNRFWARDVVSIDLPWPVKKSISNFNLKSKIDGCSLKRIGETPFKISEGFKCVGFQTEYESSVLLVDKSFEDKNGTRHSVMYEFCLKKFLE